MTITRKAQILIKRETVRGQNANPGASDAVLVYDPEVEETTETDDRVPAGPSMSRDFVPIGLQTRTVTFRADFRGSGDTSIAIDEPDWAKILTSGGFRSITFRRVPLTSLSGTGYQIGEKVSKDANNWGVAVSSLAGNGDLFVAEVEGTISSTGTLTGASSGTTGTIGTTAAAAGLAYASASDRLVTLATASWSGGTPVVGDVATVTRSSIVVGAVRIAVDLGSMLSFDVEPLWGEYDNGDTLTVGAKTCTLNAAPVPKQIQSVTARVNKGGFARDTVGGLGQFELSGEAGGTLTFAWTIVGAKGPHADLVPASTSGLSSIRPPRLMGAVVGFGVGNQLYRLPVKSITIVGGQTLAQDRDANATSGSIGAELTDRDPEIRVTVNAAGTSFDWLSILANSTTVRFAMQLGSTAGNIVGCVAPVCQVVSVTDADSDGIATYEVTLKPRRQREQGDDEMFFWQR